VNLVDYDWLETQSGGRLHHATLEEPEGEDIVELLWGDLGKDVTLDCGRTANTVWIPGPFTRMSMVRCRVCCTRNGLPWGIGSPKNDDGCRKALGLN
jgi:hypothetical protein